QTGIALTYDRLPAPLDGFDGTITQFFESGGQGLNVTVPFKEQAFKRAFRHLSQRATIAGAVNTLWQQNGALHGCNTDGEGLLADLIRMGYDVAGRRVLVLGAGGAARGAVPSLLQAGCSQLHIANRTTARARQLVNDLASHLPDDATR